MINKRDNGEVLVIGIENRGRVEIFGKVELGRCRREERRWVWPVGVEEREK